MCLLISKYPTFCSYVLLISKLFLCDQRILCNLNSLFNIRECVVINVPYDLKRMCFWQLINRLLYIISLNFVNHAIQIFDILTEILFL